MGRRHRYKRRAPRQMRELDLLVNGPERHDDPRFCPGFGLAERPAGENGAEGPAAALPCALDY
jgi:hypothetical protein